MTDPSFRDLFNADSISLDTRKVNDRLAGLLAVRTAPADLAATRVAFSQGLAGIPASPKSPHARTLTITGSGGDIALRVIPNPDARGVYLHIHGGGWIIGTNDMWDDPLERLGRAAGLCCVSVDYRLAPEHPYPAAIDDCVDAALWLVDHAQSEFGTSWLTIGGESAGAHLSVATLLRLRDAGRGAAFKAANLLYGCYDLSLTPSVRRADGTAVIDRTSCETFASAFTGGADPRDPSISPLYADLAGMPPALFSVGTLDPLVDDSLFMHMRWQSAGNASELRVYPGGVHGFNSLDGELAEEANRRMSEFLLRNGDTIDHGGG